MKGVDRVTGTTAQQRSLLDTQLKAADAGATGAAKGLLDAVLAWDGSYDRTNSVGTLEPGVAAWEALKDAAVAPQPRAVPTRRRSCAWTRPTSGRRPRKPQPRSRRGSGRRLRRHGVSRAGCTTSA